MILLHNVGQESHSNYNTREQILACNEVLSFDGVYRNVFENKDILEGKEFYLFVVGDLIGKDNTFDLPNVPKPENFCTLEEILELGGKLGWHTKTHRDLTTLSEEEIRWELDAPAMFKEYLAYPYGKYDDRVVRIAQEMGYRDAWSVTQGTGEPFKRKRNYL